MAPPRRSTLLVLARAKVAHPSPPEVRALIRRMSTANPGGGAPRIHGELGKPGIPVSEYMVRQRRPPSQTWRAFLNTHVRYLVSADFFVVPTATFRLLSVFGSSKHCNASSSDSKSSLDQTHGSLNDKTAGRGGTS